MSDAATLVERFLSDHGVFSGSMHSPVGEFTSLNIEAHDSTPLISEFGEGLTIAADDLVGHWFVRRADGTVRARKYGSSEDLAQVQKRVHEQYQQWVRDAEQHQE